MKEFAIIMVLLIVGASAPAKSEGQMIRKLGGIVWRTITEETAEKAGKTSVRKSAEAGVRSAAKSVGRKTSSRVMKETGASLTGQVTRSYGGVSRVVAGRLSARSNRRLLMLADSIPEHQKKPLMELLSKHPKPNSVITYLYQNRGSSIAGGAIIGSLLLAPEEIMHGTAEIVKAGGSAIVTPLAQ
ncbi:MAG: hypothetical protein AAGA30_02830, partial [Planctomycetota bacterium]